MQAGFLSRKAMPSSILLWQKCLSVRQAGGLRQNGLHDGQKKEIVDFSTDMSTLREKSLLQSFAH